MKKRILFMMVLIALLCGCQAKEESTTQEETPTTEKTTTTINTEYFTVEVPKKWKGAYAYEVYPDSESYAYTINFYEIESRQEMDGGFLFGISLYDEDEDISYLPSYEEIGMLKVEEQTYQVIVEYPTDVQFSDDTAKSYNQLCQDVDNIIQSIKAKDGCTLNKQ